MATLEQVKMAFDGMRRGTFNRIKYGSKVGVSAAARNEGWSIWKITEKTVQFGGDYNNMKSTREYRAERNAAIEAGEAPEWRIVNRDMQWVEGYEHEIAQNAAGTQYYVAFLNAKNTNRYEISYQVTMPDGSLVEVDKEELKTLIDENPIVDRRGNEKRIITDGTYNAIFGTTTYDAETGEATTTYGAGASMQTVKIEGVMMIAGHNFVEDAEELAESYRHARKMRMIKESRIAAKKARIMEMRQRRHEFNVMNESRREMRRPISRMHMNEDVEEVRRPIRRHRISR